MTRQMGPPGSRGTPQQGLTVQQYPYPHHPGMQPGQPSPAQPGFQHAATPVRPGMPQHPPGINPNTGQGMKALISLSGAFLSRGGWNLFD